jgi:hypothetical protein
MIQGAAAAGLLAGMAVDYNDDASDADAAVANDAKEAGNETGMVEEREVGEDRAAPASDRARGAPAAAVDNGAKDARDEMEVPEANTAAAVRDEAPAANTAAAVSEGAQAASTAAAVSDEAPAANTATAVSEGAPAANTAAAVSDEPPAANTATALSSQASAASQQGVLSTTIHLDLLLSQACRQPQECKMHTVDKTDHVNALRPARVLCTVNLR